MNLQLRPELQKFVEEKVKAGEYTSGAEVVEAGLARLMLDPAPELDDLTVAALEEGDAQADRGEVRDWKELRAELVSKYLPFGSSRFATVRGGNRGASDRILRMRTSRSREFYL